VIQENKETSLQKKQITTNFVKQYYIDLLKAVKDVPRESRGEYLEKQVKPIIIYLSTNVLHRLKKF
jgi:hypothetical protein